MQRMKEIGKKQRNINTKRNKTNKHKQTNKQTNKQKKKQTP